MSIPFVTGNAAINAVEFYQIRKILSDNPEPVQILYLQVSVTTEDPKTLQMESAATKLKDTCSLEEKL